MRFETFGPFYLPTNSIITTANARKLKEYLASDPRTEILLAACGCYIFGIKSSGSTRVIPWYVGKAEKQSVLKEATNAAHLQMYNEIFDGYKRGRPAFYFLPAMTPGGRVRTPTTGQGSIQAIKFLEDWLIATAYKTNPNLWNVRSTKMLRELYVRGIFNPKQGDSDQESADLKICLGL